MGLGGLQYGGREAFQEQDEILFQPGLQKDLGLARDPLDLAEQTLASCIGVLQVGTGIALHLYPFIQDEFDDAARIEFQKAILQGAEDDLASIAISWQDVIARNLFDVNTSMLDRYYPTAPQPCGWATNAMRNAISNAGIDARSSLSRVPTMA